MKYLSCAFARRSSWSWRNVRRLMVLIESWATIVPLNAFVQLWAYLETIPKVVRDLDSRVGIIFGNIDYQVRPA